jgi:hypothetical protein
MNEVIVLENPDDAGPFQGSQGSIDGATGHVIERQEPGGFTGPDHEMPEGFGPVSEGPDGESFTRRHTLKIATSGQLPASRVPDEPEEIPPYDL